MCKFCYDFQATKPNQLKTEIKREHFELMIISHGKHIKQVSHLNRSYGYVVDLQDKQELAG